MEGGLSVAIAGVADIISLVGDVWDLMISNPLLTFFVAGSLLTAGIKFFGKAKKVAKG